jgi:hypothetical protein
VVTATALAAVIVVGAVGIAAEIEDKVCIAKLRVLWELGVFFRA